MTLSAKPRTRSPAECPICGAPASPVDRPFCSARCRDVDLNRWLSGAYAIPGAPAGEATDEDEES